MSQDNKQNERLTKVETCMQYIQKDIEEIKNLIKDVKDSFKAKDIEYNEKFATKKELETAKQLEDRGKLLNNPIIWVVVITLITTAVNLFSDAILSLFK